MAVLNVISGPSGAGKTTCANAFARREGEARGARAADRSVIKGASFAIEVTPDLFDLIEGVHEPPEPVELTGAVVSVSD